MSERNDWTMLLLIRVTKEKKRLQVYLMDLNSTPLPPIYKEEVFQVLNMLSSRFFSRTSLALSKRNFSTSIFNMAPQHRQVAVIGSGPAGKLSELNL